LSLCIVKDVTSEKERSLIPSKYKREFGEYLQTVIEKKQAQGIVRLIDKKGRIGFLNTEAY